MAAVATISKITLPSGAMVVRDTDCDATGENDVFTGACTLWEIDIDNSANAAQQVYFKMWDAATTGAAASGDFIIPVAAGAKITLQIPEGIALATGCSFLCSSAASAHTSPTSDVVVAVVLST